MTLHHIKKTPITFVFRCNGNTRAFDDALQAIVALNKLGEGMRGDVIILKTNIYSEIKDATTTSITVLELNQIAKEWLLTLEKERDEAFREIMPKEFFENVTKSEEITKAQ